MSNNYIDIDYLVVQLMDGSNLIWEVPSHWIQDYKKYHKNWNVGAYYKFTDGHYNNCGCQLLEVL